MTKIFNFALKIKGGGREAGTCEVLRPCHPPPPQNLEHAPERSSQYLIHLVKCTDIQPSNNIGNKKIL